MRKQDDNNNNNNNNNNCNLRCPNDFSHVPLNSSHDRNSVRYRSPIVWNSLKSSGMLLCRSVLKQN